MGFEILALAKSLSVSAMMWVFLGCILFTAGIAKALDERSFIDSIRAYGLLPGALVTAFGKSLPWIEILVGIGLILEFERVLFPVIAGLLFFLFAVAVGIKLIQGERGLTCGCFGAKNHQISWWIVLRNCAAAAVGFMTGLLQKTGSSNISESAVLSSLLGVGLFLTLVMIITLKDLWNVNGVISRLWVSPGK